MQSKKVISSNIHQVFIADEKGIVFAFTQLKSLLNESDNNCLTLIYLIPQESLTPLFKSELGNIEKRFFQQLVVYYIDQINNFYNVDYNFLEIVINSNIKEKIQFTIYGDCDLTEQIKDHLQFLGITKEQIIQKSLKQ